MGKSSIILRLIIAVFVLGGIFAIVNEARVGNSSFSDFFLNNDPRTIPIVIIAVLFFGFVIAYYFVKYRKAEQPRPEVPKPVSYLANAVIVVIAILALVGISLFSYIIWIFTSDSGGLLISIVFFILMLYGLVHWIFKKIRERKLG